MWLDLGAQELRERAGEALRAAAARRKEAPEGAFVRVWKEGRGPEDGSHFWGLKEKMVLGGLSFLFRLFS